MDYQEKHPKILRLYKEDHKVDWIAHVCGVSTSYVSQVANEAGLRRRDKRTEGK
jgi:DNA-directed RNA polymerase specialized sigma subunit